MDDQAFSERIYSFVRKNLLVVILASLGLIFFAYGLIYLLGSSESVDDIAIEQQAEPQKQTPAAKIMIDVEGQVVKPGVYSLSVNARVQDALVAAFGLSQGADRAWVVKNLNLASKLTDGAKIYIPAKGEIVNSPAVVGVSLMSAGVGGGQINLNNASLSELDTLPGVGPVTAQKIIQNRPYSDINELISKKAVNAKVFEEIREKVSAY